MSEAEQDKVYPVFHDEDSGMNGLQEVVAQVPHFPKLVNDMQPGSEKWRRSITATKVPAILGVDGFGTTRYSLWHQLAGNYTREVADSSAMSRGRCLERGVADWWQADHPEYDMEPAGTWQHPTLDWAYATPDFLVQAKDEMQLLEVKTSARMDGFGDPARGVIPPHYWAQIAWQAIVTATPYVNLTVLGSFLERRDYFFEFDEFTLASVLEEVQGFVDTLPGGPNEWEPLPEDPLLDWQTILAVTPVTVETTDVSDLYPEYAEAKRAEREAKKAAENAKKRIMSLAASAEVAMAGDVVVAKRSGSGFRFQPVRD